MLRKWYYEVEISDKQGPVGLYVAELTALQAQVVTTWLEREVAKNVFASFRVRPYPRRQAHVQVLNFASLKSMISDDVSVAKKRLTEGFISPP